jgi:hypothetical protein
VEHCRVDDRSVGSRSPGILPDFISVYRLGSRTSPPIRRDTWAASCDRCHSLAVSRRVGPRSAGPDCRRAVTRAHGQRACDPAAGWRTPLAIARRWLEPASCRSGSIRCEQARAALRDDDLPGVPRESERRQPRRRSPGSVRIAARRHHPPVAAQLGGSVLRY